MKKQGRKAKQCRGLTRSGERYRGRAANGSHFCGPHSKQRHVVATHVEQHAARLNYSQYINSDAWKAKRRWFIEQQAQECFCCRTPYRGDFHVHHVTYENLGAEKADDLRLVRVPCYDKIHAYERSHNVSILEATNYIRSVKGGDQASLLRPAKKRPPSNVNRTSFKW